MTSSTSTQPYSYGRYLGWLALLLLLFVFRVAAQVVQKFFPVTFLPPFEDWYSGAIPYEWLLLSQLVIIVTLSATLFGFLTESISPRRSLGWILLIFGTVYFCAMTFRLIAAFTFAEQNSWLAMKIPAFFHIVLASFVLLVGHFHLVNSPRVQNHD